MIIAPLGFSFALHGDLGQPDHRDEIGYCKKCNKCGKSNKGRKQENDLNNCSVPEEGKLSITHLLQNQARNRL